MALDGAHVEFAASIRNPIGLKIGPDATPDGWRALIRRLSPDGEPGRLTLITRLGASEIRTLLPAGTQPSGIHIEFTGDNVTECVGGSHEINAEDLDQRYETACDPRLSRGQALDLAFTVAEFHRSLTHDDCYNWQPAVLRAISPVTASASSTSSVVL